MSTNLGFKFAQSLQMRVLVENPSGRTCYTVVNPQLSGRPLRAQVVGSRRRRCSGSSTAHMLQVVSVDCRVRIRQSFRARSRKSEDDDHDR